MSNLFIILCVYCKFIRYIKIFFTLKVFTHFYQKLLLVKKYFNTTLLEMPGNLQTYNKHITALNFSHMFWEIANSVECRNLHLYPQ